MILKEDVDLIVQQVLLVLKTQSKSIEQLTPVEEFDNSAFIEINGGRRMSASIIADAVGRLFLYKYVDDKISLEGNARRLGDEKLTLAIKTLNGDVSSITMDFGDVKKRLGVVENDISDLKKSVGEMDFKELKALYFSGFEKVSPSLISETESSRTDSGMTIFDENSKTFLYKVNDTYYRRVKDSTEIGRGIMVGRFYICGNRMFVGMPNRSLSEITESRMSEI